MPVFPSPEASLRLLKSAAIAVVTALALTLGAALGAAPAAATSAGPPTTLGSEFFVEFSHNPGYNKNYLLFLSGPADSTVEIDWPDGSSTTERVVANTTTTIEATARYSGFVNSSTEGQSGRAARLVATSPISVYGLNRGDVSSDAFVSLPVEALGVRYRALTFPTLTGQYPTRLSVIATDSGTTNVTVTPRAALTGHAAGTPYDVALTQGQVYTVTAVDVTGTVITADKKISVTGSTDCSKLAEGACDHIVEIMPPVAAWGQDFLLPDSINSLYRDTYRVLADQDGTVLTRGGTTIATLNAGEATNFRGNGTTPLVQVLTASKPVLVLKGFGYGDYVDQTGDPSSTVVPPTSQFLNEYTVSTAPRGFDVHTLTVIAKTAEIGSILLNGTALESSKFLAVSATDYSVARFTVAVGSYHLAAPSSLAVYVEGFTRSNSYAYAGGYASVEYFDATSASIYGDAVVGELLTATVDETLPLADPSYVWLRDGAPITGATDADYALVGADLGAVISVAVTGMNLNFSTETATSGSTTAVAAGTFTTAPVPTISGTAAVDQTLSAATGEWLPSGATLTYQWLRNSTAVTGATASTYALTAADLNAVITVTVTAVKAGYVTASTTSVATAAVAETPFTGVPIPVVTGTPTVDQTLTAAAGDWAPTEADLTYQWLRNGEAINDATGSTYLLTPDDLGAVLTVAVTAVKTGYVTETVVSVPTAIIVAAPFTAAPIPTISGTNTIEQTLTATPGDWAPTGATLTYQWLRNGTPIDGATTSTYLLGVDDFVNVLTVQVTGVKTGYVTQNTESLPTEAIAAAAFTTTAVPTVTGYAMVNQALTATIADWEPVAGTITWQWLRNGIAIDGATSASYVLAAADEGALITVTASGSAAGYITASTVSDSRSAVAPTPSNSTPAQTLTADTKGMITVSGYGFIPGESVEVWLHSTPTLLGTLVAAANGTVSGSFALPKGTSTGVHHIVLTGLRSGSVSSVDITVIAPAAVASTLSKTGVDASLTGWLALLLAISGLGLVVVRRRRAKADN